MSLPQDIWLVAGPSEEDGNDLLIAVHQKYYDRVLLVVREFFGSD
jgi:hypothetical protein